MAKKEFRYKKMSSGSKGRTAAREGMVRKEFWLDPKALRNAMESLGTSSERETVQMALDLVAFRDELATGVKTLRKLNLRRID